MFFRKECDLGTTDFNLGSVGVYNKFYKIMKYLVNGQEKEFNNASNDSVQLVKLHDRWLVQTPEGTYSALTVRQGDKTYISCDGRNYIIEKISSGSSKKNQASDGEFNAPMPGQVVDVLVKEGDKVSAGDKLLVLEAMKTQQAITAPFEGKVASLPVSLGAQVSEGDLLIRVEKT